MTEWIDCDIYFRAREEQVNELCLKHFGQEHSVRLGKISKKPYNNHGRWINPYYGKFKFRYRKDLLWFLLIAGYLQDIKNDDNAWPPWK